MLSFLFSNESVLCNGALIAIINSISVETILFCGFFFFYYISVNDNQVANVNEIVWTRDSEEVQKTSGTANKKSFGGDILSNDKNCMQDATN